MLRPADSDIHKTEEISQKHVMGNFGELWYRFRVPGGWIYSHSLQDFRGWGRTRVHMTDTFVPDPPEK